jgi:N-acetyl-1-D-myo-inositol-2-amino-2-deoxy-alpha-D-glucopyranoside deacetylase
VTDPAAVLSPPRGILAVFAHPDDESFGMAGTLTLAAAAGLPVHVVCATDGDLGGEGESVADRVMAPDIRRGELRGACRAMGIGEPVFLGYGDSGMEGWGPPPGSLVLADTDEVVDRIVEVIVRLRPEIVVTFDPNGIYGHPDHTAISRLASEAYRRTAILPGGPRALFHQVIARRQLVHLGALFQALETADEGPRPDPTEDDRAQEEAFTRFAVADDAIDVEMDVRVVIDRKLAAMRAHATQIRMPDGDIPAETAAAVEAALGRECFVRVDPPSVPGAHASVLWDLPGEAR